MRYLLDVGRRRGLKGDNGKNIFSRKVSDDEGSAVKCPNFASGDQICPAISAINEMRDRSRSDCFKYYFTTLTPEFVTVVNYWLYYCNHLLNNLQTPHRFYNNKFDPSHTHHLLHNT
jgi:hypothetical protein